MKKSGIYIIKNKVNEKVYIGQSVDISARWCAHKNAAKNLNTKNNNTAIHKAMFELGIENFYMEILEECSYEKLSEREIFWISQYNSYNNGYNMTLGGESNKGETNGRALLTQAMVEEIRLAYANHVPFREVYKKYKNTISKRGLQKVWRGENWTFVMMEVYTEENKRWHATYAKSIADGNLSLRKNNQERACSEEEIKEMRRLRGTGMSYGKISQIVKRSIGVVRKYCLFLEAKDLSKNPAAIMIKNIETGLVFPSYTQAAKWAKCERHTISRKKDTQDTAGIVPTTGQPAHWISL